MRNKIFIVSHKNSRGTVRWTGLRYDIVTAEDGTQTMEFIADVRLADNTVFSFSGTWNTGEPEELFAEVSFHSEVIGQRIAKQRLEELEASTTAVALNA